ncbi:uncharacterized protein LOC128182817 [Crassostrea angulata]|uniref:uncharacterized protein LOC128182817 n=1 Tax=Magallana angulata TaxID=2784310 RepID=UPI0022B21787|nr:uncharacterized protein LOC128182817 [Crassostrea angulata]
MVKHCCWGTCRSDSRYAEGEHMEGVSWFPFPKPITQLEKCQRWVKLCGRKNFTVANVNKSTYICSKHFLSGRPTEEHPDPIPAAGTSLDILRAQKRKRRVLVRVNSGNVLGPEEKKIKNDAFCLDVGANMEIAAEEAEETVVTCTSAHDEDVECVPVIKEILNDFYKINFHTKSRKI